MFRRLIIAIFRLYMKYLLSSYTKHTWVVYMGKGGRKVGTRFYRQKEKIFFLAFRSIRTTQKNIIKRSLRSQ